MLYVQHTRYLTSASRKGEIEHNTAAAASITWDKVDFLVPEPRQYRARFCVCMCACKRSSEVRDPAVYSVLINTIQKVV